MDVPLRLSDLSSMHPQLLWETIIAATAAVLDESGAKPPYPFAMTVEGVLGFGSDECRLLMDPAGVSANQVAQVRRTYEPSRLIEFAAIAITALTLHHAGGHEIRDVALRGSAADYLVDHACNELEIAGRSRRSDVEVAWRQRRERLSERGGGGFYLCVVEFEGATGRLAFVA
jgi:hypothetical protein